MKKTFINSLLITSVLLLLFSCKSIAQKTDITSIDYTETVGRGGRSSITVTADSISRHSLGGRYTDLADFSKKIDSKDWNSIFLGVDVSLLKTTESGKSRGAYDGNDTIITLKTNDNEYRIVNTPENNPGYKNLERLQSNIQNLVSKYQ